MIPVTKPLLPEMSSYQAHLDDVWASAVLTNHGPKVQELERRLAEHLAVGNLHTVVNGTLALQIALRAIGDSGPIITTPFSFVATASSAVWEGFEPVFADIHRADFNADPNRVEDLLRKGRSYRAILVTHVYGQPCDVGAFAEISRKYNTPVIYDAAHAFGVKVEDQSILNFGEVSTLSFHATKVFHTVEGGAVFSASSERMERMRLLRNFGHITPETFSGVGTNAKMSELHAAMGLCILDLVDVAIAKRRAVSAVYDQILFSRVDSVKKPKSASRFTPNYAYYPILLDSGAVVKELQDHLYERGITTRRYFYPSLNKLAYVQYSACPVAEEIAERVLCLPLFPDLPLEAAERIARETYQCVCG